MKVSARQQVWILSYWYSYIIWTSSLQATLIVMHFGQFLDHDLDLTPEIEVEEDCCSEDSASEIPGCFPILIQDSDPTFPNVR